MADWNKRYLETGERLFGENPNEYVREVMARSDVNISSALMIADDEELARVRRKENYGRYRKDASAAGKPPAIVRA